MEARKQARERVATLRQREQRAKQRREEAARRQQRVHGRRTREEERQAEERRAEERQVEERQAEQRRAEERQVEERQAEKRRAEERQARELGRLENRRKERDEDRSIRKKDAIEGLQGNELAEAELRWAQREVDILRNLVASHPSDFYIEDELAYYENVAQKAAKGVETRRIMENVKKRTAELYRTAGTTGTGPMSLEVPGFGTVKLRKRENPGDGDCLYISIAQGQRHKDFKRIRNELSKAITDDREGVVYSNAALENLVGSGEFNYKDLPQKGNELREVVAQGNNGNWWGDIVTLRYAAKRYRTMFIVLGGDSPHIIRPQSVETAMLLWYDQDKHYRLIEVELPDGQPLPSLNSPHQAIVDEIIKDVPETEVVGGGRFTPSSSLRDSNPG
jgi:hypothetical protein